MKAQLLTMSTPDGPFTIIARDGAVLASGWTAEAGELTGQIHPELLPADYEHGGRPRRHFCGRGGLLRRQSGPGHGRARAAEVGSVPQPRLGRPADGQSRERR